MMPNTRMNSRGASSAISTAEAPSSRRSRALPIEALRVDRLEGLVERDRVRRRSLLDRLVVDARVVQLLARLQQQVEPDQIDLLVGPESRHGSTRCVVVPL